MNVRYLLVIACSIILAACSVTNPRIVTRMNVNAALTGDIPFDPLKWRVITSGVDANHATMFTVFGNDAAIRHARSEATPDYPAGSVIALALWRQREHRRWVGGRVPAQPVSLEFIEIQDTRQWAGIKCISDVRRRSFDRNHDCPAPGGASRGIHSFAAGVSDALMAFDKQRSKLND